MDGVEGFEPPIPVPKTGALPLGDTPTLISYYAYVDGIIADKYRIVKYFVAKYKNK